MHQAHGLRTTLILDLGDVLFRWSPKTTTSLSPRQVKQIMSTVPWFEYERGRITQAECYSRIAADFQIDADVVADTVQQARESLQLNDDFITVLRELRKESQSRGVHLTVIALSNISLPDYEYILSLRSEWTSIFDRIFASAVIGERKPHLGAFRHVVSETKIDPRTAVFVDDKLENVASARSLGMHGIVFDNQENVFRQLRNIFGDPVQRGINYLQSRAGSLESVTDDGHAFVDNFSQLLIYEMTNDRNLLNLSHCTRTWNYFRGKPLFYETFPDDLDTTSLALTILPPPDRAVISSILDQMLTHLDADGIMQTYFDHSRPRIDAFVCVNVLALFFENGRGHQLPKTLDWIYDVLLYRAYNGGSRYYSSADCFLFFVSRLLQRITDPTIRNRFRPLFVERVSERIGTSGNPMDLAFRILAAHTVGIDYPGDLERLKSEQCDDGGWELCWFCLFGSTGMRTGNRGLTTALAVKAIETTAPPPLSPTLSTDSSVETLPSPVYTTYSEVSETGSQRKKRNTLSRSMGPSWLNQFLKLKPSRRPSIPEFGNFAMVH